MVYVAFKPVKVYATCKPVACFRAGPSLSVFCLLFCYIFFCVLLFWGATLGLKCLILVGGILVAFWWHSFLYVCLCVSVWKGDHSFMDGCMRACMLVCVHELGAFMHACACVGSFIHTCSEYAFKR